MTPDTSVDTDGFVATADKPAELIDSSQGRADEPAILAEIVVDELSIDGMCGVY